MAIATFLLNFKQLIDYPATIIIMFVLCLNQYFLTAISYVFMYIFSAGSIDL